VHPKTGNIDFRFSGLLDRNLLGVVKAGAVLNFNIYESDSQASWTKLNASLVTVNPGGEAVVVVRTQKAFLKVSGYSTGNGGLAKMEVTFQGSQFFGQLDVLTDSKKDGFPTSGSGSSAVASSPWPASSLA
jgi:hypothetical protein